ITLVDLTAQLAVLAAKVVVLFAKQRTYLLVDAREIKLIPVMVGDYLGKIYACCGVGCAYFGRGLLLPRQCTAEGRGELNALRGKILPQQPRLSPAQIRQ